MVPLGTSEYYKGALFLAGFKKKKKKQQQQRELLERTVRYR
jgi:hypothetical protein